jgi:hypothetical protein
VQVEKQKSGYENGTSESPVQPECAEEVRSDYEATRACPFACPGTDQPANQKRTQK